MHRKSAGRTAHIVVFALLTAATCALGASCGGGDHGGGSGSGDGTQTGQSCSAPSECYPDLVDGGVIQGTVTCLTQVTGGYCTHTCAADTDCCDVKGECIHQEVHPQVCASFESMAQKYCFLSCEDSIVGTLDSTVYCQDYANAAFGCRSTGGGAAQRKVCLP